MSAPEELPLPSLEQLIAWDTDHFSAAADWCDAEAATGVSCFDEANSNIRNAQSEGQARNNAVHSCDIDLGKVRAAAEGLTDSGKILRLLGDNERFAKKVALRAVEEAQETGYTVNFDLSVSETTESTSFEQYMERQNKAKEFAEDIRYEATSLVRIDRDMAAKLPR
jgi:hypothetical protein